jgi:hypothetical protein
MFTLSILKTRIAVLVAALSVAFVSPALRAQGPYSKAQVDVPFGFEVGSTHFAAGRYILSSPREFLLVVQGSDRSAISMMSHEINRKPSSKSKAVFHHYGSQYFLRELWIQGNVEYVRCSESKAEQEARRAAKETERASAEAPANVEVALLESPR